MELNKLLRGSHMNRFCGLLTISYDIGSDCFLAGESIHVQPLNLY